MPTCGTYQLRATPSRYTIVRVVAAAINIASRRGAHNIHSGLVACTAVLMVTNNYIYTTNKSLTPHLGNATLSRLNAEFPLSFSDRRVDARHNAPSIENVQTFGLIR
jgi:hypothetical protein